MLTVSRDRAKPASRAMNPACMKNTRNAVTSTHTVLIGLMMSAAFVAACDGRRTGGGLEEEGERAQTTAPTATSPSIFAGEEQREPLLRLRAA